jgi:hypothetical protein
MPRQRCQCRLRCRLPTLKTNGSVDIPPFLMVPKPDVGATIARSWFDRDGVDVITDVPGSAIALAVGTLACEKDKVALFGGAGAMELSGRACSPNHGLSRRAGSYLPGLSKYKQCSPPRATPPTPHTMCTSIAHRKPTKSEGLKRKRLGCAG